MKKEDKKLDELKQMLIKWLDGDLYKAGYVWNYIEKRNEGFGRGWRMAVWSIIRKIEEEFE